LGAFFGKKISTLEWPRTPISPGFSTLDGGLTTIPAGVDSWLASFQLRANIVAIARRASVQRRIPIRHLLCPTLGDYVGPYSGNRKRVQCFWTGVRCDHAGLHSRHPCTRFPMHEGLLVYLDERLHVRCRGVMPTSPITPIRGTSMRVWWARAEPRHHPAWADAVRRLLSL
jgi:hypothetical protein